MLYLHHIVKRLMANAPLRLRLSSIAVSTATYAISIALLSDRERGALTAFLYGSYIVVGISFFGANMMIAHWAKGQYSSRLKLSSYAAIPGLVLSVAIIITGVGISTLLPPSVNGVGTWFVAFGAFVFVWTLGETIFAAKASSVQQVKFWQHYLYFTVFLGLLTFLVATENLGVLQIVIAYIISSIPFFFTSWAAPKQVFEHAKLVIDSGEFSRRESTKLFLGTFFSNMHTRLVSLAVAAVYGAEYLGKYIVLWLAFEVIEELYRVVLLTEITKIKNRTSLLGTSNSWAGLSHVFRIGFPSVMAASIIILAFTPFVIEISDRELITAILVLTANYLGRLILNFRLNHLRATAWIGLASKIAILNTGLALLLASALPKFFGFEGVAIGILTATLVALFISLRFRQDRLAID